MMRPVMIFLLSAVSFVIGIILAINSQVSATGAVTGALEEASSSTLMGIFFIITAQILYISGYAEHMRRKGKVVRKK